jgi:hypothetical protein
VVLFRRADEYRTVAPPGTLGYFEPQVWLGGEGREPMAVLFEGPLHASARPLGGRITVRFLIQPDGSVTNLADEGSTLPDQATIACVVGELAQLRFPAREAGGSQLVVRSLNFSRARLRSPGAPAWAPPGAAPPPR